MTCSVGQVGDCEWWCETHRRNAEDCATACDERGHPYFGDHDAPHGLLVGMCECGAKQYPVGDLVAEGHDAPFGHCARCLQDLPISTGADGSVIASVGYCPDCDLTTMWEVTDAT